MTTNAITFTTNTTLTELAEMIGEIDGAACSPPFGAELREAADWIRQTQSHGNTPERGEFGHSDAIDALTGLMAHAGATRDDIWEVECAWVRAAHSAEDAAILAADDEARADAQEQLGRHE